MKNNRDESGWSLDTQLVRSGTQRSNYGETSEAIFMNSGFCYDNAETAESRFDGTAPGFVYSRYTNPTLEMLENRLAALEGAERALVMASGMAAVFAAIMTHVKTGDHLIAGRVMFGSCHYIVTTILPRYGVEVTLVDGPDEAAWAAAFKPNTVCVFLESPANPTLELIDIAYVAGLCKKHGVVLIVDNIFASPLHQKPLELGADLVVYSTTKHLEGQGRTLGGAILGSKQRIEEQILPFHRHTGPAMSPFNAWVILKGLETFRLRVEQQCKTAAFLAEKLEQHPKIAHVLYPGLPSHPQHAIAKKQMKSGGAMIAFEVKGGKAEAFRLLNAMKIIDISNNLGDSKSLITHPATTTHQNMPAADRATIGITDGMLRFSVGLEDASDLWGDLESALKEV